MRKVFRKTVISMTSIFLFLTSIGLNQVKANEVNRVSGDNIALNKPVKAIATKAETSASSITDGNIDSYWQSGNDYNRWVEIDLEGVYDLKNVVVHTPLNYISNYNIYVSQDNENYKKVASKLDDVVETAEGTVFLINETGCKIRIDVTYNTKDISSYTGFINEVKVYGDKVNDKTPATPEIKTVDFKDSEYGKRYDAMESDKAVKDKAIIDQAYALVSRVAGEAYVDDFEFVLKASANDMDTFRIEDNNGKVKISGPNGLSLAAGFNYYLKNDVHVNYDPIEGSKTLVMPTQLPKVSKTVVKETPYDYKYALNFCTPSYTMAFWNWEEYEPFLDWSAMNGINLMLDFVGQEEVQRRMLKRFNYTDEDVKEYIPGPAYYGWFYMQNMQTFGGPLPNAWFEQRTDLGRKIHERMYVYGIEPVYLGFAGQVPLDFAEKNPDAQKIDQGYWPTGTAFARPPMLRTYVAEGEDYFDKVSDAYYEELKSTFGDTSNHYAVDPFHEGGKTDNLDMGLVAKTIQAKIMEHNPDSIWVVQNWQGNPSEKFLGGLVSKDQALVLDLYADNQPHYQTMLNGNPKPAYMLNDYNQTPWIWGMLHSFGGRMGFSGMPEILAEEMPNQLKSEYMKGIGVTAESLATNPMLYEMIYDMGWEKHQLI